MARTKTTDKVAAESCGMTVEQWQQAQQQAKTARTRGRRPTGTAGADPKLATWGPVENQMAMFTDEETAGEA
ncbi:hypothetical protein BAY61_01355 [Prauserella marina]|uniref:Uncharacterized protein n=1 Tax=Prauserella marina TaxID=530584 RepID=A0A222VIT9_9PSEU|nr:hypothetical protein [Prauserella marina]ASR33856.1 hypothetical protein BAY61_01355 [Prauserella marina]PWV82445.1 hypothetical protein DES30_102688 [Prauserella marina]SDC69392.1 hypothetical protein SAMN05421630_103224 [Prauserella marina]